MPVETITLIVGLIIGGIVAWSLMRARIQYAAEKGKVEAEAAHATLAERLQAKEQQIQGLTSALDKANEEFKRLQHDLMSECEKRAELQAKLEAERSAAVEKLAVINDAKQHLSDA